jgi:oligopeptide/dipeptide ABC transporter ATP-binding protein
MPKATDEAKSDFITINGTPPDLRLTGNFCNFCNRCEYAQEKCFQEAPEFIEIEENHFVACHRQTKSKRIIREK